MNPMKSSDFKNWEREFIEGDNTVNYCDLREDPEKYLFRCDFFELKGID